MSEHFLKNLVTRQLGLRPNVIPRPGSRFELPQSTADVSSTIDEQTNVTESDNYQTTSQRYQTEAYSENHHTKNSELEHDQTRTEYFEHKPNIAVEPGELLNRAHSQTTQTDHPAFEMQAQEKRVLLPTTNFKIPGILPDVLAGTQSENTPANQSLFHSNTDDSSRLQPEYPDLINDRVKQLHDVANTDDKENNNSSKNKKYLIKPITHRIDKALTPLLVNPKMSRLSSPVAQPDPVINVSIGRIEVRAVQQTEPVKSRKNQTSGVMGLDEYLRKRSGETHE